MTYLLDTNVLSEMRRQDRMNARVKAWADSVAVADQYLSVITLLEIELGVLSVSRRDKAQAAILRSWIDTRVLPSFAGRILSVDATVALRCAQLHVPDPRPELDALIAATALVHGLQVVTRNVADFQPMGVKLLNPWG
jgi:predicted nucleic acid-binding protein